MGHVSELHQSSPDGGIDKEPHGRTSPPPRHASDVASSAQRAIDPVRELRSRAERTRRTALILLVLMVVAIVGGGLAFYDAGRLVLTERMDRLSELDDVAGRVKVVLGHDLTALQRAAAELNPSAGTTIQTLIRQERYDELSQEVQPLLTEPAYATKPFVQEELKALLVDVENNLAAWKNAKSRYEDALRVESAVAKAENDGADSIEVGWGGSLDTMTLRATIAVLLIFLVQILSALQRYYVQVAAHYDAIADAFLLSGESAWQLHVSDFERLVDAMRPNAFLGRAPKTIPQELADVVLAGLQRPQIGHGR